MKNNIICNNIDCLESIDIDTNDFDITESNEDDTIWIIECPHCHHNNAITFYKQIHYQAKDANAEDLKNFSL